MVDWLVEISLVPAGASLGTYTIEAKDARNRVESWLGPIAEMAEDHAYDRLQAAEDAAWRLRYDLQQVVAKAAEGMAFRQLMKILAGCSVRRCIKQGRARGVARSLPAICGARRHAA